MVIDEQFAAVNSPNHVAGIQIPIFNTGNTVKQMIGLSNLVIRRNGWIYVYVSNESDQNVYFDNLILNLKHGPLLEQKDYYAFGMEIPGLSTKAIKYSYFENKYRFGGKELQSKEFRDTSGLELYDYSARMYDPQVARFIAVDPITEKSQNMSTYQFSNNSPLVFSDPTGMTAVGADGLTNEQWLETSKPDADSRNKSSFSDENKRSDRSERETKAFWTAVDGLSKGEFNQTFETENAAAVAWARAWAKSI